MDLWRHSASRSMHHPSCPCPAHEPPQRCHPRRRAQHPVIRSQVSFAVLSAARAASVPDTKASKRARTSASPAGEASGQPASLQCHRARSGGMDAADEGVQAAGYTHLLMRRHQRTHDAAAFQWMMSQSCCS